MKAAFDLISDIDLQPNEVFNIADKPSSLFCIVAGNVSSDLVQTKNCLEHLSRIYRGVFYIDGALEHTELVAYERNIGMLSKIARKIDNLAFLHTNVVVVDGIALVAANGWYGNYSANNLLDHELAGHYRINDLLYLRNSIQRLQKHQDVKHIIVITSSIPNAELGFHAYPDLPDSTGPSAALAADTESKVKLWLYGSYQHGADVDRFGVKYVNNPYRRDQMWWPRRIEIPLH